MARTYWAEGRTIAKLFFGIFVIISCFLSIALDKWGIPLFFVFLILSAIFSNMIGSAWTRYRREQRDLRKKNTSRTRAIHARLESSSNKNTKSNYSATPMTENDLLKANIDTLSGEDFERLMAMYFKWKGYEVKIIGGSGDHGVDLVLRAKDGMKIAVQCKRWSNNVGNEVVLKVSAGKRMYDCLEAWVVTTSYFTPLAKEAAQRNRVRLINGIEVHDMINSMRKHYGIVKSKYSR